MIPMINCCARLLKCLLSSVAFNLFDITLNTELARLGTLWVDKKIIFSSLLFSSTAKVSFRESRERKKCWEKKIFPLLQSFFSLKFSSFIAFLEFSYQWGKSREIFGVSEQWKKKRCWNEIIKRVVGFFLFVSLVVRLRLTPNFSRNLMHFRWLRCVISNIQCGYFSFKVFINIIFALTLNSEKSRNDFLSLS